MTVAATGVRNNDDFTIVKRKNTGSEYAASF